MPISCPHCSRKFKGGRVSPRHLAVCPDRPVVLTDPCLCGHRATSGNKMKAHRKTCEAWQTRDKRAVRNQRRTATNLERYGVEEAAHAPEVRARRAATNLAKYGAENPFCKEASTFDKVQASLEGKRPVLRGADNPFAKPEVKAKIRETMLERYGAENPQQVAEIRAKTTATCEARYGGVLLASEELAEKARATNLARYGDEVPQRTEELQERVRATNMERYGVPWTCMDPEVRAKQLETHHERYGSHWFASDEGKAEIKRVLQERYGVDHWMQTDGAWDRLVETFRERYGVDHPLQLAEFLDKQRETNLERHGWDYYMNSERFVRQCLVNAGVPLPEVLPDHPMQNREYARLHLERMSPINGPNGLETAVQALAPDGSILFTGDFTFWRWLPTLSKHKNPDFIVPGPDPAKPKKGVTKVVEAFGDFWHSRMFTGKAPFDHEQDLIEAYAEIGIECLVLWEGEVHGDPESVRSRLEDFLEAETILPERVTRNEGEPGGVS